MTKVATRAGTLKDLKQSLYQAFFGTNKQVFGVRMITTLSLCLFVLFWLIVAVSVMTEMSETSLSYISNNEILRSSRNTNTTYCKKPTKKKYKKLHQTKEIQIQDEGKYIP